MPTCTAINLLAINESPLLDIHVRDIESMTCARPGEYSHSNANVGGSNRHSRDILTLRAG